MTTLITFIQFLEQLLVLIVFKHFLSLSFNNITLPSIHYDKDKVTELLVLEREPNVLNLPTGGSWHNLLRKSDGLRFLGTKAIPEAYCIVDRSSYQLVCVVYI